MSQDLEQKKSSSHEDDVSLETQGFFTRLGIFFLEVIKVVVLAAITIVVVRSFLFKPFVVEGQSMEPTYFEREYLLIDELSYHLRAPERGEVIVFRAPSIKKEYYLKRVIGLPGERVKIENNKVIIFNDEFPQGKVMEEKYLEDITSGPTNILLAEDQYFVMGDNRDQSYDSRKFGPINKSSIVGRTWIRGYPFGRIDLLQAPHYNF